MNNPEFYRLRIAGQIINIAIDSTETVDVKATYPQMSTDYTVKGSYENEKIKELALKQNQIYRHVVKTFITSAPTLLTLW